MPLMYDRDTFYWVCDLCGQAGGQTDLEWVFRLDVGTTACRIVHKGCVQDYAKESLSDDEVTALSTRDVEVSLVAMPDWDFHFGSEGRGMKMTLKKTGAEDAPSDPN